MRDLINKEPGDLLSRSGGQYYPYNGIKPHPSHDGWMMLETSRPISIMTDDIIMIAASIHDPTRLKALYYVIGPTTVGWIIASPAWENWDSVDL